MNLILTGLNRLFVLHRRCLAQHYGHNQIRHFQARALAIISLALGLILIVFTLAFALTNSSLIAPETKLVFMPLKVLMSMAFVTSYVALLKGREAWARRVIGITLVGGVMLGVVLTGGFPKSVAAPILLLPAITFFCLYGARGSADGDFDASADAGHVFGRGRLSGAAAQLHLNRKPRS